MEKHTNTGLVKHVKMALNLRTKYMWGGILRTIEKQYATLKKIYGTKAGTGYTEARWKELSELFGKDCYGVDCVGLVKSYLWSGKENGGTGSPMYGKSGYPPDINANLMFQRATEKGPINTLPEIPGLILYSKTHPHVGVYIGDGWLIESTLSARGDGVSKAKVSDWNGWTHWFKCPYIEYAAQDNAPQLKPVTLAYNAVIRSKPSTKGADLGLLKVGSKCVIVIGSDTVDADTKYTYVKLAGDKDQWIVKSAIK
jgi:hypothetical protein